VPNSPSAPVCRFRPSTVLEMDSVMVAMGDPLILATRLRPRNKRFPALKTIFGLIY
jgi:hypothetical protein